MPGAKIGTSLVLVAHRSGDVLPRAVAAFRRSAEAARTEAEVIVVEQSERATDEEAARPHADHLIVAENRGYAAGVNLGVARAKGEVVVVANPDVELEPAALGALFAALADGWGVVGPQFTLGPFLFPPAEPQQPVAQAMRWAASRWRPVWARWLAYQAQDAERVWRATRPVRVAGLSGALLAVRRRDFERIGPWDEGYFLYFEETQWLRRAERGGLSLAVVPAARAEHDWGHAAGAAGDATAWGASRRRYLRREHGVFGSLVVGLDPVAPPAPPPWPGAEALRPGERLLVSPADLGWPGALHSGPPARLDDDLAELVRRRGGEPELTLVGWDNGARPRAWRWAGGPAAS